jgi:hypothetical protein
MAATESSPLRKLSYTLEAARMSRYERQTLARFHHIIAVSENDRQQMLEMDPTCEITVVPTGVDTEQFQVAPPSSATPPRIVFTGSMDWEPNIDAVEYFCEQIWPRILAEFPDAIFQIVGRHPFAKVQRLASTSVQVTGTVPSVTDYLRDATVVVVPLRIGGGTRLKIYEAMAMGKALVSTSIGAEGLSFQNGRDLLLADDASSFADAILLLLRDAQVRRRIEQAAVQVGGPVRLVRSGGTIHGSASADYPTSGGNELISRRKGKQAALSWICRSFQFSVFRRLTYIKDIFPASAQTAPAVLASLRQFAEGPRRYQSLQTHFGSPASLPSSPA